MSGFIPPYPPRPTTILPIWQRVMSWRKSILEGWEERAFECDFDFLSVLGRKIFLCNSPESVQFAFSNPNGNFDHKNAQFRHSLIPLIGDSVFVAGGERWRRRRRAVTPAIHMARLPELAPAMVEIALETRARLAEQPPAAEFDMLSTMARLSLDIMGRTIFGSKLPPEDASDVISSFAAYQRHIVKVDVMSMLGLPDWLPRWYARPVRRAARKVHAILDRAIARSPRAPTGAAVTILDRLRKARGENGVAVLDLQGLHEEVATILTAGQETTANMLSWVWYLLSQAPEVEARLHAEIDRVLGERPPSLADVGQLVYTRAIVEETMRLYPPVPVMARDALADDNFNGVRIPKGSIMMVAPWLLHRHKKLWCQPDHFMPERFLPGGDEPVSKYAYIPFSIGPRICAGMAFGLTEAILCVAVLAQQFQFRLKPGHQVSLNCRLSLRPGETLPMTLHRRVSAPQSATRDTAPASAPACPFGHG